MLELNGQLFTAALLVVGGWRVLNPAIHAPVGKLSFTQAQLKENAEMLIDSVAKAKPSTAKGVYVKSITIAGTMTPGVRVDRSMVK